MLAYIVNSAPPEDLLLKLFENDVEPSAENTVADFIEPWLYDPLLLPGSIWVIDDRSAQAPPQVIEFQGYKGFIHGYFIVTGTTGKLMWAERFSDGPYEVRNKGDKVTVTLNLRLDRLRGGEQR